jgi:DNA helicase-2/ATP-dependent DNA helicase PcrA
MELDHVNPVLIKHEYSFTSHILLYENCPAQYKFFKELEFSPVRTNAALFGTLVHETIEDVHRAVLEGKPDLVTEDQIDAWFERNYRSLSRSTHTYLAPGAIKVAKRQVQSYVERSRGNWEILRAAEVLVSLLQKDYILRGKIDLIRGEGDKVEVLDFKTEKKPAINTPEGREKLERYRRQLDVYAHIVEGKHGYGVSRMHLYFTGADSESPYVSYDFEERNVARTIVKIDGVVRKIEDKDYGMSDGQKTDQLCGNCDMRHYCGSN